MPAHRCHMNSDTGLRNKRVCGLYLLLALIAAPGVSFSQAKPSAIPANAHASVYGSGWDCSWGFRRTAETCVQDDTGDSWKCEHGFKKRDETCVTVAVPANGFLDESGSDWQCDRGFQSQVANCVALVLPANAHLDFSGNDWRCVEGFKKSGTSCVISD
jgi:hypothetical protein